jgi:IPT/TIG domain
MMKKWFWMKRNIACVSVVALTLVLGFAVIASATSNALTDFNTKYPGNSFNNSCNICHANPYGAALKAAGGTKDRISLAQFGAVEGLDSDGDGFTNLEEITEGTFPGDRDSVPAVPAEITSIVPASGSLGTQFTISGSGLGDKKGKIVVSNDSVSATLKIANGGWTKTLISAALSKALPPGTYDVTVYPQPYKTTDPIPWPVPFTVEIPALGSPSPTNGPPGTEITITGSFFGTKKGKVYIEGQSKGKAKIANCKVTFWDMNPTTGVSTVSFLVPKTLDPGTYPLTVTNKVGSSAVGTTFEITIP